MQGPVPLGLSARTALRRATAAIHERLHEAPPFAAITQERMNPAGYSDLLRRIAAFHFTVGPDLQPDGSRQRLLARDLDVIGAAVPGPVHWNPPPTSVAKLGCAYVIEGSCLGGKVIYRQLDYLFGHSSAGRHFFRGSASDGQRWQALCRELEAEGQNPGAIEEMIDGAAAAFAFFEQLISRWGDRD